MTDSGSSRGFCFLPPYIASAFSRLLSGSQYAAALDPPDKAGEQPAPPLERRTDEYVLSHSELIEPECLFLGVRTV